MTTTGYSDVFGRTVAGGLGSATSGQPYTLFGAASQFSVTPNTASIAISSSGDKMGYVDFHTQGVDITAQVAFSNLPSSGVATAGFVCKLATVSNYYSGTLLVTATSGIMQLRFSKVISGGLSTISTTIAPYVYTPGTFYNLRYTNFWSNALQANVMQLKVWPVGGTEPGGWMAMATDSAISQYAAGTNVGIFGRDEGATPTVTAKYQNVLARSYNLPVPAPADPMCADPTVSYPKQTQLQSLAVAADAAMVGLDASSSLAALYPRARISATNATFNTASQGLIAFDSTEFNIGTSTNLGYDNTSLFLPVGIWLLTVEVMLAETSINALLVEINGGPSSGQVETEMRSNATQANSQGTGGCGHLAALTYVTDPVTPNQYSVSLFSVTGSPIYTIKYAAFSAIKISDYFT